jgi:hypothetical protein
MPMAPGALTIHTTANAGYSREVCIYHAEHVASVTGCAIEVKFPQAFDSEDVVIVQPPGAKRKE